MVSVEAGNRDSSKAMQIDITIITKSSRFYLEPLHCTSNESATIDQLSILN